MTYTKIKENVPTYSSLEFTRGSVGFDNIQPWLLTDFIPKESVGVMYGKSGSRKSFIAIDISCAIATGSSWHNHRTLKSAVVYVAAEGQIGISKRIKAWEIATGQQVEQLYTLGQAVVMSDTTAQSNLIQAIHELEKHNDIKVGLIVLDTLARNFGGDENSGDAMGKFIRGCDLVKTSTGASVVAIHHSGKDVSKGGRGHSSLNAAIDCEFQVSHDSKTGLTTLSNTKMKDAEEAPDLVFDFKPIDLGITCEEGEPITSLALLTPATIKNNKSDTNDDNNPMLKALRDVFGGSCARDDLRKHCFPPKEGVAANTTNQKFKRALTTLVDKNLVFVQQKGETANRSDIITAVE
ncbi:Cro/Cl family transcriptional regulator [Vibrio tasmaniensis ZS-17]|uniref:helicase RepA family protein n=1 Tax=Vibrio tasmaniensis TaxID=212663 RepID=UPI000308AD9E|nr:helicase RepA family protein [Vibrio tasmaniensis]OED66713.1 Cro/Cl family transcriptional regulator [Vibrio tasmaniensis ZS-17]